MCQGLVKPTGRRSAPTDESDDLDGVAFVEWGGLVLPAGHDLLVDLDRDGMATQAELLDQFPDGGSGQFPRLAVENQLHGGII